MNDEPKFEDNTSSIDRFLKPSQRMPVLDTEAARLTRLAEREKRKAAGTRGAPRLRSPGHVAMNVTDAYEARPRVRRRLRSHRRSGPRAVGAREGRQVRAAPRRRLVDVGVRLLTFSASRSTA